MGTDRRSRRSDRRDDRGPGDGRKESKRGRGKEKKKSSKEKKSRSRDRSRRDERGESDSSRKPVLVPAQFPTVPPPPRPAGPPAGEEPEDFEEGEEESEVVDDPNVAAPAVGTPTVLVDVEAEGAAAKATRPVPGPAEAETGGQTSQAVAHREDAQLPHQGEGDTDQGHKPGEKSSHQAKKPKGDSDKSGRYDCSICGRSVGGGIAGSWQHRRSGYHLGAYIYWNNREKLPWKHCLDEGQRWSRHIWATGESGPEDEALPNKPVQKKEAPVPVRCDPERSRRDKDDQGDRGDPDTGAGSSGSSGNSNLLLQMWQTTLKELR